MSDWEVVIRPHLTPYFAYAAAAVIVAAHVTVGFLLADPLVRQSLFPAALPQKSLSSARRMRTRRSPG